MLPTLVCNCNCIKALGASLFGVLLQLHFSTWCLFGVLLQDHFLHLVPPCCYILSTHLSTRLLFNAGVSTRSSPMLLTLLRNSLAYVGGLFGLPSQTLDLAPPLLLSAYLICSPQLTSSCTMQRLRNGCGLAEGKRVRSRQWVGANVGTGQPPSLTPSITAR